MSLTCGLITVEATLGDEPYRFVDMIVSITRSSALSSKCLCYFFIYETTPLLVFRAYFHEIDPFCMSTDHFALQCFHTVGGYKGAFVARKSSYCVE